ncbi:S-adenosyl-L-methionine-dependent methyltransferase [Auriscalpium vulgare]|uniref:S-adenosyl-L-methionine-dependent methyltransferase n=1 Tax=Auriscalpium vulgare TaxID=40419 RepID=A0ACB8RR59_9AGAM|nr:S-adenosyl-L-methionine-dependent methyltransferase [Auriscalpium vulgare]
MSLTSAASRLRIRQLPRCSSRWLSTTPPSDVPDVPKKPRARSARAPTSPDVPKKLPARRGPKPNPDKPPPSKPKLRSEVKVLALPPGFDRLPPIPPPDEWRKAFPLSTAAARDRVSIRNPATAVAVARAFINGDGTKTGQPKTVIEAFPGPGLLSRALLTLPPSELGKLIILEDYKPYLEYLRPLAEADPRVTLIEASGFSWQTYTTMEEERRFDTERLPWGNELHPNLHFITHIPQNIPGEQLVAQLLRCVPEKSWLFKHGRVPMSFILPEWLWRRVIARPEDIERCKLSVIAEAVSDFAVALPSAELMPFNDHFHPVVSSSRVASRRSDNRIIGNPLVAVNVIPQAEQLIDKGKLEQWDFILRRLFVLKNQPLSAAMSSLAPGADTLLKTITNPELPQEQRVDIRTKVKKLTVSDWALIARAFDDWAFAPEDLTIDSYMNQFQER